MKHPFWERELSEVWRHGISASLGEEVTMVVSTAKFGDYPRNFR